ncbi:MAG: C-GCAxxG-C-C family protein [Syntrophorhabdaceae bacterium]|nr:C-GCAxxG-C-C family protein [Syntrophorhabdaceae bacterium]
METDRIKIALDCFNERMSCSQAIMCACAPELGLDKRTALKVACAFGGGMARMGEICGAATGAFMVIGLRYGESSPDPNEAKEKTYQATREFVERFKSINGSIICRDLLGLDISTDEGRNSANEMNLFRTRCTKFVKDAAEILEELIFSR